MIYCSYTKQDKAKQLQEFTSYNPAKYTPSKPLYFTFPTMQLSHYKKIIDTIIIESLFFPGGTLSEKNAIRHIINI